MRAPSPHRRAHPRWRLCAAALSWLAACAALGACQVGQALEPPQGGLQRMVDQPRYDAFDESSFFEDGLAMRHPPSGTVPFSLAPLAGEDVRTGRVEARVVQSIPGGVTRARLQRGRERYDVVCATCHGLSGRGESAVARSMKLRPPPSLVDEPARSLPPGHVFRVISEGYGYMPSLAVMLTLEERWAIVAYLEALRLSQRAEADDLPRALRDALEREAP